MNSKLSPIQSIHNWKIQPIKEVILKTKNRDPSKKPVKYFKYIDVSSVDNSLYKITSPNMILGSNAPSRARKEVFSNDILFATVRPTLKRIAIVPNWLNDEIASTGFCVLRANESLINHRYLYYFLLTDSFIKSIGNKERGVSYPAIKDSDIHDELINIPPLFEQQKISTILSLVQTAIEQQTQLIELTTELKKALMKKIFTEGLRSEPQKMTEIGLVPESWDVQSLGSLSSQISKGASPRWQGFEYTSNGVLFIRSQNIGEGIVDLSEPVFLPISYNAKEKRSILRKDDLLINLVGASIGRVAIGPDDIEGANCNQAVCFVRMDKEKEFKEFLVYFFLSEKGQKQMFFQKKDIARANLSLLDVKSFLVPIPKKKEITEIADIFTTIESKISFLKTKKETFEDLFRTLLQQLMTGQIRVNDLDLSEIEPILSEVSA